MIKIIQNFKPIEPKSVYHDNKEEKRVERISWDQYFIEQCNLIATRSKDQNTKIGCVIVSNTDNKTIVSQGYNCFPRGINDTPPYRQDRKYKYHYFSHAEANALSNALRNNTSVYKGTLYLNQWIPCADCARLIIQSGIKTVVTPDMTIPERWRENTLHSLLMLREADVFVSYPDSKMLDETTTLIGELIPYITDTELRDYVVHLLGW